MNPVVLYYTEFTDLKYETDGAAAVDLRTTSQNTIMPGETHVVGTGTSFEIPEYMAGEVSLRSSTAKKGIILANAPGLIDSDYRGEVKLILTNVSNTPFELVHGHRIAQIRFVPVHKPTLRRAYSPETLSKTKRGSGGLGSTGV